MCVCFPQMPLHSFVKYIGGKLILTLEGEDSLGQYHIVKTTNLKLLIYVGHSFPHRAPIWEKFMSKLGKGSQGLPRKHLGGRREVKALLLLDRESHLGDWDEEPLLNTCILIIDSMAKLYSRERTPPKHSERKNDKELIWIYPLKGHKGRADAALAWRVKLQGLTQKVYFCSLLGLLQAANSKLHILFGYKSAHKRPHSRDAQGCRSLELLPRASLHPISGIPPCQ